MKRRVQTKAPRRKVRSKPISLNKNFWLRNSSDISIWREQNKPKDGFCPILKNKPNSWVVDHCHFDLRARGVISAEANKWEGYVLKYFQKYCINYTDISLSDALRNLADYLETDYWLYNPLHVTGIEDMRKHLNRCKIDTIKSKIMSDFDVIVLDKDTNGADKLKADYVAEYLAYFILKYENDEV